MRWVYFTLKAGTPAASQLREGGGEGPGQVTSRLKPVQTRPSWTLVSLSRDGESGVFLGAVRLQPQFRLALD